MGDAQLSRPTLAKLLLKSTEDLLFYFIFVGYNV